jgi:hypothetical protein
MLTHFATPQHASLQQHAKNPKPTTFVVRAHPDMGISPFRNPADDYFKDGRSRQKGDSPMVHDLVLALVFLAMIIAPALLAMRSEKEENDTL